MIATQNEKETAAPKAVEPKPRPIHFAYAIKMGYLLAREIMRQDVKDTPHTWKEIIAQRAALVLHEKAKSDYAHKMAGSRQ